MPVISLVLDSVRSKVASLKQRRIKYVTSLSSIQNNELSIEYTKILLPKACKRAELYYMGETIAAYRSLLIFANQCIKNANLNMETIADALELYVNGWQNNKIITESDLTSLQNSIHQRLKSLKDAHAWYEKQLAKFNSLNASPDEDMVDHVSFNLFDMTTEFPYRRAYNHFFKKYRIQDRVIEDHLKMDDNILDMLIQLISSLYAGWEKSGKGEAFEEYRHIQHSLIELVQLFADSLELDIQLYEKFAKLNETVVAFKLYPSKR